MWKINTLKPLSKSFISSETTTPAFIFDINNSSIELKNLTLVSNNYNFVSINFDVLNREIFKPLEINTDFYIAVSNLNGNEEYKKLNYFFIPYVDYTTKSNLFYYYSLNRFETTALLPLYLFTNEVSNLNLTLQYSIYNISSINELNLILNNPNLIDKLEKVLLSNSEFNDKLIDVNYIKSINNFSNIRLDFYFKFNISNLDSESKIFNLLPSYKKRNCKIFKNNIGEYINIDTIVFEKYNYKKLFDFSQLNDSIKYFYIDNSYIYLIS